MLCFHKKNNPSEVDPINHNLWIVCKMQSLPIHVSIIKTVFTKMQNVQGKGAILNEDVV